MDDYRRTRAREWLRSMRGTQSQDSLVADINATIEGWSLTRDRYSKYESGSVPFGTTVLGHFEDYWASKGQPGPDFTPATVREPLDPWAILERQTALLENQSRMLERLEQLATHLVRMIDPQPPLPAEVAESIAWMQRELLGTETPRLVPRPVHP